MHESEELSQHEAAPRPLMVRFLGRVAKGLAGATLVIGGIALGTIASTSDIMPAVGEGILGGVLLCIGGVAVGRSITGDKPEN